MKFILFLLWLPPMLWSQGLQDWQVYTYMNDISDIAVFDGKIWASSDGGIYAYNTEDSTHRAYTNIDGLASIKITALEKTGSGLLVAGTEDGVIHSLTSASDQWQPNFDMQGETIRDIHIEQDTMWVATDNGLGVYLLENNNLDFRDFYNNFPIAPVLGNVVYVFNGMVFYGTQNGIIYASSNFIQQNLKITDNWNVISDQDGLPSNVITALIVYNSDLLIGTPEGPRVLGPDLNLSIVEDWTYGEIYNFAVKNDTLHFFRLYDYFKKTTGGWEYGTLFNNPISAVIVDEQNELWIGFERKGLRRSDWEKNYNVSGPGSNHVGIVIKDQGGDLWMTSGKFKLTYQEGFYRFDGHDWTNYRFSGGSWIWKNETDNIYEDSEGRIWIGSWGGGLTLIDGEQISFFHAWPEAGQMTISSGSSEQVIELPSLPTENLDCLVGANVSGSDNYTVITSFSEDINNNIWLINYFAREPKYITIVDPTENEPVSDCDNWIYLGDRLGMSQSDGEISSIEFDAFGRLWMGTFSRGILVLDYNQTISDPDDDQLGRATMTTDNLFSNTILSIKEDKDQIIWIGTAGGLNSYQPDPSGLSNRFFKHVGETGPIENKINNIFVDDFNNKWFATDGGISILIADKSPWDPSAWVHYTTENSGLPDKIVNSIYVDSKSGAAYIGTESGLAVFKGAYTEIRNELSHLAAGPNPFLVDGQQEFVIKNLVPGAFVKILTINGRLIRELTLENGFVTGGRARWDGRDMNNRKVPSGIYLYLVYNEEGTKQTGKISVIRP